MRLWDLMWQVAVLVLLVSIAGGTTLDRLACMWPMLGFAETCVVLAWLCWVGPRKKSG